MKPIVIISGKGGTERATLAASFASLAKNKVIADRDVDAPDLHLLLKPEVREKHEFTRVEGCRDWQIKVRRVRIMRRGMWIRCSWDNGCRRSCRQIRGRSGLWCDKRDMEACE